MPPARSGFERILGHQRAIDQVRAHRQSGRLSHAYCLTGEGGIGKTSVARALAEELLSGPGQPRLDVHPDFWIDDRAEAISIDEIRYHPEKGAHAHDQSLQQFLSLRPFSTGGRVAILANAERMTEAAQNCLLKTLEEPPPNTVLLLTTAFPDHLLPTCLSRCLVLALAPVPRLDLAHWLRESQGADDQAEHLAGFSQGRPGWALRAMESPEWLKAMVLWADELAPLAFGDTTAVLTYAVKFGQGPVADQRRMAGEALQALTAWLRDAMLLQAGLPDAMTIAATRREALGAWAARLPAGYLGSTLGATQRTQLLLDQNVNPRFAMEVLLLDFRLGQSA